MDRWMNRWIIHLPACLPACLSLKAAQFLVLCLDMLKGIPLEPSYAAPRGSIGQFERGLCALRMLCEVTPGGVEIGIGMPRGTGCMKMEV